jgi:GAF domain-containing protein
MNDRETRLTETFVALADTLVRDFDLTDLLHTLASTRVSVLEATAAGILLAGPSETLQVVASSEERIRLLELFELQNEQGPCTDCYRSGRPVHEPDLRDTERWPLFTAQALREGFASVDAIPLRLRDTRLGALNLFNETPGGLPEGDRRVAQALADVAAIGLLQERAVRESRLLAEQLQHALNSRVAIEQAKGILAEQGEVDVGDAFERLRRHARATSTPAAEVANLVIRGELAIDDLH